MFYRYRGRETAVRSAREQGTQLHSGRRLQGCLTRHKRDDDRHAVAVQRPDGYADDLQRRVEPEPDTVRRWRLGPVRARAGDASRAARGLATVGLHGRGLRTAHVRHTTVGERVAGRAAGRRPVPCAFVLGAFGRDSPVPGHGVRGQRAPVVGRRAVQERHAHRLARGRERHHRHHYRRHHYRRHHYCRHHRLHQHYHYNHHLRHYHYPLRHSPHHPRRRHRWHPQQSNRRRSRSGRLRDSLRTAHRADGQKRRPHGAVRSTAVGARPHQAIHVGPTVR